VQAPGGRNINYKRSKNLLKNYISSKRDEVSEEFRIELNNELHDLGRPLIVMIVKTARQSWTGHVIWLREKRSACEVLK
jgi:hypothetical protein